MLENLEHGFFLRTGFYTIVAINNRMCSYDFFGS